MLPEPADARAGRKRRVAVEGLKYYSSGWAREVVDLRAQVIYSYRRQHRAVLTVEANLNGLSYHDYVRQLKTNPAARGLKALEAGYVVHHRDENPKNDTLENLQVMTKAEHDRHHTDETNFNVQYTAIARVRSIEALEPADTYDVQMADPANNLVVNDGPIVHYTGSL